MSITNAQLHRQQKTGQPTEAPDLLLLFHKVKDWADFFYPDRLSLTLHFHLHDGKETVFVVPPKLPPLEGG